MNLFVLLTVDDIAYPGAIAKDLRCALIAACSSATKELTIEVIILIFCGANMRKYQQMIDTDNV